MKTIQYLLNPKQFLDSELRGERIFCIVTSWFLHPEYFLENGNQINKPKLESNSQTDRGALPKLRN
jgi:hypothetical protein